MSLTRRQHLAGVPNKIGHEHRRIVALESVPPPTESQVELARQLVPDDLQGMVFGE